MKKKRYRRRPGDFEIRLLPDGRLVMVAPDEKLLEVARAVAPDSEEIPPQKDKNTNGRHKKRSKRHRKDRK